MSVVYRTFAFSSLLKQYWSCKKTHVSWSSSSYCQLCFLLLVIMLMWKESKPHNAIFIECNSGVLWHWVKINHNETMKHTWCNDGKQINNLKIFKAPSFSVFLSGFRSCLCLNVSVCTSSSSSLPASYILLFFLSDSPKSSNMKSKSAKCEEAKVPSKKDSERRAVSMRPDAIPKSPGVQHKKGNWAIFMMELWGYRVIFLYCEYCN